VIGSEELDAIFEEIGKITKITKQPDTSGVYRVVYENSEDANLAVDQLHDLELMNARLEVLLEATYLAKTSSTSSSSSSSAPVDETSGIGMVDALSRLSSKAAQSTSVYVLMSNLFAPEGADQDEEENWQAEIRDDVQVECGEIAGEPVTACCLDPSSQGCVYIHMPSHDMALKIINTFNNRWFAERQIGAALITKDLFESKMKMFGADE
jgi:RNA recognition motif-containing protein